MMLTASSAFALTANEIMTKAATNIRSAKGIYGSFVISSSGKNLTGTFKAKGAKFTLMTSASSSWYNGKHLWTYNPSSGETTLFTPTAEELLESNPLEYLKTYSNSFTSVFSKKKISGKYIVSLIPKSKKNQIKQVEIVFNNKTLKPEKFTIENQSGSVTMVNVKSLDYARSFKASEFEYPRSKYPKSQIIDLR